MKHQFVFQCELNQGHGCKTVTINKYSRLDENFVKKITELFFELLFFYEL